MYAGPVQDLIDQLGRLPGIGPKSAQRIAFHLLKVPEEEALRLARSIVEAKRRTSMCVKCFNIAEAECCAICNDPRRDGTVLCVVEDPRDIVAVERTREFRGRYHVLQGAINPIEGIGPDQLKVRELLARIGPESVSEVILCTNPNLEGEATAMYLARLLSPLGLRVTRIASGLPVGGDLEYADELTLGRAIEGRRDAQRMTTPTVGQVSNSETFTDIDHIGIAVLDLDAAVAWYETTFGVKATHRERVELDGVEEALIRLGDSWIQLLTPTRDDSPVARWLERRGEGLHHIAYRVADCALALQAAKRAGASVVDERPRAGSRGTVVAFLHPKGAFGTLIELVQV